MNGREQSLFVTSSARASSHMNSRRQLIELHSVPGSSRQRRRTAFSLILVQRAKSGRQK
jgi:hypothetical protein